MTDIMRADKFLEEEDIEFELVKQDNPTLDCDDAAIERGVDTSQIVKSLVLERDGEIFHVLVPGDRELSEKKFGESRLLPPEESKEVTGFESGAVHPFSTEVPHFVDERVLEKERVSFTTGDSQLGVIIDIDDFREALDRAEFDYTVKDFVVTIEEDVEELEEKGVGEEIASFLIENGYRSLFLDLSGRHDSEKVADAIEKLNRQEELDSSEFGAEEVEKLVERAESGTHMLKLAEKLAQKGELPDEGDGFELEEVVETVIEENLDAVEDYRGGRDSALNYLLGAVMEQTNGRADGGKTRKLLLGELDE